jgi:hypothetical protein
MKQTFFFLSLIFLLTSCGGVTTTPIEEFKFSVDLPSGWKIYKDNFRGEFKVEISTGGRRVMYIKEANPSVASLDMLVQASSKSVKVINKESFANGFGVTLKTKKKKQFRYYVQKDDKQYMFEPAAYYKDTDLNKAITLVKSVK